MIINYLKLYHFKNFEFLEIEPEPGVNLFVGANGSGKTALLEAIRVGLGCFFDSNTKLTDQRLISFEQVMIQDGRRSQYCQVFLGSQSVGERWGREYQALSKSNDRNSSKPFAQFGSTIIDSIQKNDQKTIAPLIAFYSTQRQFREFKKSTKYTFDPAAGRINGYIGCLEDYTIRPLMMDWLNKAVILRASKHIQEIDSDDQLLSNVENAIRFTIQELFNLPETSELKIYPDSFNENELFLKFNKHPALPLDNYSDGFKNLVNLIMELVWRASLLNPWLTLQKISDSVSGIVLIDEIDLHLHPKWQGKAIGLLQKLFPKVQFFVTTHSPTVVANFENNSLYIIDQNQVNKYTGPYFGLEINAILTDILGGTDRNIKIQDQIDSVLMLIDTNPADPSIQPKLDLLTKKLGVTDPQVQLALSLFTWAKENNLE